jgi:hypothetical protein
MSRVRFLQGPNLKNPYSGWDMFAKNIAQTSQNVLNRHERADVRAETNAFRDKSFTNTVKNQDRTFGLNVDKFIESQSQNKFKNSMTDKYFNYKKKTDDKNFLYREGRDEVTDNKWEYQFDFNKMNSNRNHANKVAQQNKPNYSTFNGVDENGNPVLSVFNKNDGVAHNTNAKIYQKSKTPSYSFKQLEDGNLVAIDPKNPTNFINLGIKGKTKLNPIEEEVQAVSGHKKGTPEFASSYKNEILQKKKSKVSQTDVSNVNKLLSDWEQVKDIADLQKNNYSGKYDGVKNSILDKIGLAPKGYSNFAMALASLNNIRRSQQFGATVPEGEMKAFEDSTVTMNTADEAMKERLPKLLSLTKNHLGRVYDSMATKYGKDVADAYFKPKENNLKFEKTIEINKIFLDEEYIAEAKKRGLLK